MSATTTELSTTLLTIEVPTELVIAVKHLALDRGTSMTQIMRPLIEKQMRDLTKGKGKRK